MDANPLDASVWPLLNAPWILDVDVTIKPLYGKQEGAVLGYNPKKPGRPSHAYHTYQMAGLRLMLGIAVAAGNQSHSNTTLPGLIELMERLPIEKRPHLVRGDAARAVNPRWRRWRRRGNPIYSSNDSLTTSNVILSAPLPAATGPMPDKAGKAKTAKSNYRLEPSRRIVVLRRPLIGETLLCENEEQLQLAFVEKERPIKGYEYAVLVTDLSHELHMIAQLYRDRGDAENTFDEIKNQWAGPVHHARSETVSVSAMAVALVYNWWSTFGVSAPRARLEAIRRARCCSRYGNSLIMRTNPFAITPMHAKRIRERFTDSSQSR